MFGAAAGGANNFTTFCAMIALTGFGVGGNLPVDGTMFLEFLPGSHQYLLTLLSIWWAIGQVVASLIAWGFIARWGCAPPAKGEWCTKADNMGWRYTYITLGCMMIFLWLVRFLVLPVYESPKFLASIGKDEAAVEVIHKIAKRNGVNVSITVEDLKAAAEPYLTAEEKEASTIQEKPFTTMELLKNSLHELSFEKISTLFCNRRLAYSSSLIIFCYAALGLAYPLYNQFLGLYLAARGAELGSTSVNATYASYTYQAACGIPGSIVACMFVQVPRAGRKVAMAVFTLGAGVFLFALTAAKNQVQINALTCIASFFENAFCEYNEMESTGFSLTPPRRCHLRLRARALPHPLARHRRRALRHRHACHWYLCPSDPHVVQGRRHAQRPSLRLGQYLCPVSGSYTSRRGATNPAARAW